MEVYMDLCKVPITIKTYNRRKKNNGYLNYFPFVICTVRP